MTMWWNLIDRQCHLSCPATLTDLVAETGADDEPVPQVGGCDQAAVGGPVRPSIAECPPHGDLVYGSRPHDEDARCQAASNDANTVAPRSCLQLGILVLGVYVVRSSRHHVGEHEPCTARLLRIDGNTARRGLEAHPGQPPVPYRWGGHKDFNT